MSSDDNNIGGHLPRGPHQLAAEEVAADQRRRLIDAMLWYIATKGYLATAVADLIKRAGISRRTFYELFANREELLKTTFETCAQASIEEARAASQRTGGSTRQLEALMGRLCQSARTRPGAITLGTVEVAAAGPGGLELRERLMLEYATLISDCLSATGAAPLPQALASTLAAAAHREINAYLSLQRANELRELGPQLARWMRFYHPVPDGLDLDATPAWWSAPQSGADQLLGGRAPGTLTLAPEGYVPRIARPSPSLLAHVNRERILDAVAQLDCKHGYGALTIETISEQADLPERAFRASFESREEAFATALELGHTKGQAIVERARKGSGSWREGVRNTIRALLEFFASEPYFTHLAFIDAPLAGPAIARRADEHASAYAQLIFDGAPQRRNPPPITAEAIVHGLFELAHRYAVQERAAELPSTAVLATYLALAPFLGVNEAAATASRA